MLIGFINLKENSIERVKEKMRVDLRFQIFQFGVKLFDLHLLQPLALKKPLFTQQQGQGKSHIEKGDRKVVKGILPEGLRGMGSEYSQINIVGVFKQDVKGKTDDEPNSVCQKFSLVNKFGNQEFGIRIDNEGKQSIPDDNLECELPPTRIIYQCQPGVYMKSNGNGPKENVVNFEFQQFTHQVKITFFG
jgi:hypothetical protein